MKNTAQDELLRKISDAVRTCGEIILHADRSKSCIDEKAGHANFVTTYDKRVQQELQKRLLEIFYFKTAVRLLYFVLARR